jgi:hypothetical protein
MASDGVSSSCLKSTAANGVLAIPGADCIKLLITFSNHYFVVK